MASFGQQLYSSNTWHGLAQPIVRSKVSEKTWDSRENHNWKTRKPWSIGQLRNMEKRKWWKKGCLECNWVRMKGSVCGEWGRGESIDSSSTYLEPLRGANQRRSPISDHLSLMEDTLKFWNWNPWFEGLLDRRMK